MTESTEQARVREIAEEALREHDGWYRYSDRRRRTDEVHTLAGAYLALEARLAAAEGALRELHAEVEMAESVGICLPDRVPSLRAGEVLAALTPLPSERQPAGGATEASAGVEEA